MILRRTFSGIIDNKELDILKSGKIMMTPNPKMKLNTKLQLIKHMICLK